MHINNVRKKNLVLNEFPLLNKLLVIRTIFIVFILMTCLLNKRISNVNQIVRIEYSTYNNSIFLTCGVE